MPKITQVYSIDITPEKFLENCSDLELMEIDMLIQSKRFQERIEKATHVESKKTDDTKVLIT